MVNSFADLIGGWSDKQPIATFARDIGVTTEHAAGMRRRDSIPAAHWNEVIYAAERRGIKGVTYELLANLASRRKSPADSEQRASA